MLWEEDVKKTDPPAPRLAPPVGTYGAKCRRCLGFYPRRRPGTILGHGSMGNHQAWKGFDLATPTRKRWSQFLVPMCAHRKAFGTPNARKPQSGPCGAARYSKPDCRGAVARFIKYQESKLCIFSNRERSNHPKWISTPNAAWIEEPYGTESPCQLGIYFSSTPVQSFDPQEP